MCQKPILSWNKLDLGLCSYMNNALWQKEKKMPRPFLISPSGGHMS